jgi:hypothetical protein
MQTSWTRVSFFRILEVSKIVAGGRSAGTRLTFGTGVVAYEPEQIVATAIGGSAVIAPAVALSQSNADGSGGRGPVAHQYSCLRRCNTESD